MTQSFVVLGAHGGVGEALCRRLVQRGSRVLMAGRDAKRLADLATDVAHAFSVEHWEQDPQQSGHQLLGVGRPWLGSGILAFQVHGWRYTMPMQAEEQPCLIASHDPRLVIAGDAFAGPRVEGAARSGGATAEAIRTAAS